MVRAADCWILIELRSPEPQTLRSYPGTHPSYSSLCGCHGNRFIQTSFGSVSSLPHPQAYQISSSIFSALSVRFVMLSLCGEQELVSSRLSYVSVKERQMRGCEGKGPGRGCKGNFFLT